MMHREFFDSIQCRKLSTCVLVIVALFLSSCGVHKLDNAFISPDFSYPSLKGGGLIYAGIIPGSSELDKEKQEELSEVSFKVLKKIRGDLTIYSPKWLQGKMSSETYHSLIGRIDQMLLDEADLIAIKESTPSVRYVLFSKIIQDDYSEYTDDVYEVDEHKSEPHVFHSRSMEMQVELYDLKNAQLVWAGNVGRTETEKQTEDLSFGESIVNGIVGGIIGGTASLLIEKTTGVPISFDKTSQENLVILSFMEISHALPKSKSKKS